MLKTQSNKIHLVNLDSKNIRIAIIRTDYHTELNDNLEKHAKETLVNAGVQEENIHTLHAPGAWEIPFVAQAAAKSKKFDAIITFGVIVKGETYHFEMIANETARALMQLSIEYNIPVSLEILAVFTKKQAEERAGDNEKNKGIEGSIAVLKALDAAAKIRIAS